jgi:predicted transposase/invertase (TIGR01784 family)
MSEEIAHPHNNLVQVVMSDLAAARSFLQSYLPQELSQGLNWSTLKLREGSFIDEDLRGSETDLLYEVEPISGDAALWAYVLLEHQSAPDRWMRFRLLKYCCRIWDMSFQEHPDQRQLRPIIPLVFYQGERSWSYSTEFADLFAESVRDWPWIVRFCHGLIDQSTMQPDEVQGELKAQLMQLVMLAAYHPHLAWMERVARLLGSLASLGPSGGMNYVRIFVLYILATQEPETAQSFRDVLRQYAPEVGDDVMTYAQELFAQGEEKGTLKTQVAMIEGFVQEGVEWSVIERATGVNEAQFQALKQQLNDMAE